MIEEFFLSHVNKSWFATVRSYSHWVAIRETSFFHECFPSLSTGNNFLPPFAQMSYKQSYKQYGIAWTNNMELHWILHGSLDVAGRSPPAQQTMSNLPRQAKCSSANTPAFADGRLHAVVTGSGFWSWLFLWQITM